MTEYNYYDPNSKLGAIAIFVFRVCLIPATLIARIIFSATQVINSISSLRLLHFKYQEIAAVAFAAAAASATAEYYLTVTALTTFQAALADARVTANAEITKFVTAKAAAGKIPQRFSGANLDVPSLLSVKVRR